MRAPPTACWMVRLTSRERSCSRSQTDRNASRQPAVFGGIWGRRLLVFRPPRERPTACLLLFPPFRRGKEIDRHLVQIRSLPLSCPRQTAMIQERVRAGLARARGEGKRLGRPPIAPALEKRIRDALATPGRPGVRVIAKQFGVNPGTVQRISRPFEQDAVAL